MPTVPLPDNPDLEKLRGEAKTLRDRVREGDSEAVDLVREHHPRRPTAVRLADAQLVVARRYGYPSWPVLRRQVELINRLTRSPHRHRVSTEPGDAFLRLACLDYAADDPSRWQQAAELLAEHPDLVRSSIHTAAAAGDARAVTELLAADPQAASREGGPFGWEPLLYLTYSRLPRAAGRQDPPAVARLLLAAGADPNAGYLWNGLPSPFTALTGLFGHGEQGAPAHPDEQVVARLLLEAGAEANDSQTIYNRGAGDATARDDTAYLELLLDFGLGRGDGGPWRRRLAREHQSPPQLVGEALQHAAEAGLVERVRLLLARGADPDGAGTHPLYRGRSPYAGAVLHGHRTIAALLAAAGADTGTADPLTRFVGLCLAPDPVGAHDAADDELLARAAREHPDLLARAVRLGRPDAVRLLVELGFDVDTRRHHTALHEAALRGDLPMVALLLELGADPSVADETHQATPLVWAHHFGHLEVVEHLERRATAP